MEQGIGRRFVIQKQPGKLHDLFFSHPFGAEGQVGDTAQGGKDAHGPPGKALRRGKGVGGREGEHQVGSLAEGHFGPGVRGQKRRFPPLDKIGRQAHHKQGVFPQLFPGAHEVIPVAPVKRIVFRHDAADVHRDFLHFDGCTFKKYGVK